MKDRLFLSSSSAINILLLVSLNKFVISVNTYNYYPRPPPSLHKKNFCNFEVKREFAHKSGHQKEKGHMRLFLLVPYDFGYSLNHLCGIYVRKMFRSCSDIFGAGACEKATVP